MPVPVDLSKLSDVVKSHVVKKTDYNTKIAEIEGKIPHVSNSATKTALNAVENKIPDTSGLVKKTDYNTKIAEIEGKIPHVSNSATKTALNAVENKIPDTSGLVKKTDYNTKIAEIEGKIPDVSNLATKTALNTVENKIPDVGILVKKPDYKTKVAEIENKLNNHNHDKYIDTSEFNKLAVDVFNARITQANLVTKTDFDAMLSGLNRKITQNKTKHSLVENELNKLKAY